MSSTSQQNKGDMSDVVSGWTDCFCQNAAGSGTDGDVFKTHTAGRRHGDHSRSSERRQSIKRGTRRTHRGIEPTSRPKTWQEEQEDANSGKVSRLKVDWLWVQTLAEEMEQGASWRS